MTSIIEFNHVSKFFSGREKPAVNDVSLSIEEGSFVTILGTSGSGKTTVLKMVNGLIPISSGEILFKGKPISELDINEYRKSIGYVIQQAGLFPHRTVYENVATVPKMMKWKKSEIDERVNELLKMVRLEPSQYANVYPCKLSGGEAQRVGLARALAADPPVMLMDEPFGAIDAITRTALQDELLEIQARLKKTIMFVTHDIQEAFKMGDRVIIMHDGELQQFAEPYDIVFNPATEYVKELLNIGNFFDELKAIPAKVAMTPLNGDSKNDSEAVLATQNLSEVLELLIKKGIDSVLVKDHSGAICGKISRDIFETFGTKAQ